MSPKTALPVDNFTDLAADDAGQLLEDAFGHETVLDAQCGHPGLAQHGQRHAGDLDARAALRARERRRDRAGELLAGPRMRTVTRPVVQVDAVDLLEFLDREDQDRACLLYTSPSPRD